jgi:prepilin-type N-terminal cleavage/methylation domain-containing protein
VSRRGFTLLEAVIALAVVTAIAGVAAHALITSLRAERQALRLTEAGLGADRALTAARLDLPPGPPDADGSGWRVEESVERTGAATNRVAWRILSVRHRDGEAGGRAAIRAPGPANGRGLQKMETRS